MQGGFYMQGDVGGSVLARGIHIPDVCGGSVLSVTM